MEGKIILNLFTKKILIIDEIRKKIQIEKYPLCHYDEVTKEVIIDEEKHDYRKEQLEELYIQKEFLEGIVNSIRILYEEKRNGNK